MKYTSSTFLMQQLAEIMFSGMPPALSLSMMTMILASLHRPPSAQRLHKHRQHYILAYYGNATAVAYHP
jgi:hypothetical protein